MVFRLKMQIKVFPENSQKSNKDAISMLQQTSFCLRNVSNVLKLSKAMENLKTETDKTIQSANKTHKCNECGKTFKVKYDLKLRSLAEAQIKAEKKSISDSITKISETVSAYENNSITFTQANSIRVTLGNTSARLDGKLQSLVEQILQYLDEKQAQAEQTED